MRILESRKARWAIIAMVSVVIGSAVPAPFPAAANGGRGDPTWSVEGTAWDVAPAAVLEEDVRAFTTAWTDRFLDPEGLDAYLNAPGGINDGFSALGEDDKAYLVVELVRHWQETLPGFGRDYWTGDPQVDQEKFEDLAALLYATLFGKDEFFASLRSAFQGPAPVPAPLRADAGIPEFPGMSQEEIDARFDAIHAENVRIVPAPQAETLDPDLLAPDGALRVPAGEIVPEEEQSAPPGLIERILRTMAEDDPVTTANTVLNAVAAGTYLVCGSMAGKSVKCLPAPVPLGTPVPFDLDGSALTGVGGAEVLVLLTPTINFDYFPDGFAALLSVQRLEPSLAPTSDPLKAQVYVVYTVAQAGAQIYAGFDGRRGTLGDSQEVIVTLKDVAAAFKGDIRTLTEIKREGPASSEGLIVGHATVDAETFPAVARDPTILNVELDPMPASSRIDVRIRSESGQSVVDGSIDATSSPKVTAAMTMTRGNALSDMSAVIDRMPTHVDFGFRADGNGAIRATYSANAAVSRVSFRDVTTPDTRSPSVRNTLDATVVGVPTSIQLSFTRPFAVSYTASARVTSASVVMEKFDASGRAQSIAGTISNIPSQFSITGDDDPFSMVYSANGAIDSISAAMYDRAKAMSATAVATGVPGNLNVNAAGGQFRVSTTAAISDLTATFSKRGGVAPVLAGNHLSAVYSQGATSDLDVIGASFRMSQITLAEYKRVGTTSSVDLRMGGAAAFTARGDLTFSNGEKAFLYATLSALPTSIQATFGETSTVTTNANFDLYAYAEHGTAAAIAAAPTPPTVHGVSVRDGASGANRGIKAVVYLTGLPTSVSIDSRNNAYSFSNWRPKTSTLTIDAELDNYVSPALDAYVTLSGIPSPQSLTFSMKTEDLGGGSKRVKADLTTTASMGALFADATFGANHGRLTVSNIPDDIHVTYTNANGQTTLTWDATAAISSVYAGFRVTSQSSSFQGYVSLSELPSDFTLVYGRDSGGSGPTLSYSASASTLDLTAYADASLQGGDVKARLSFGITNLGASVSVAKSGSSLRFLSTPATPSLYASVWAKQSTYKSDSGTWDSGGLVEFPWAYHFGAYPEINNLAVTLSSFSDFSVAWGLTSKLSGTYGSFSFGWSSFTVYLDVYGSIDIVVDWPWPFGSSRIELVDVHEHRTITINVQFHKYTNHQSTWFSKSGHVICDWSLSTTVKPHPHGTQMNSLSTSAATAEGGAWYSVPNPWGVVPGWGMDLIARYTSPDGGSGPGLDFDYDC